MSDVTDLAHATVLRGDHTHVMILLSVPQTVLRAFSWLVQSSFLVGLQ